MNTFNATGEFNKLQVKELARDFGNNSTRQTQNVPLPHRHPGLIYTNAPSYKNRLSACCTADHTTSRNDTFFSSSDSDITNLSPANDGSTKQYNLWRGGSLDITPRYSSSTLNDSSPRLLENNFRPSRASTPLINRMLYVFDSPQESSYSSSHQLEPQFWNSCSENSSNASILNSSNRRSGCLLNDSPKILNFEPNLFNFNKSMGLSDSYNIVQNNFNSSQCNVDRAETTNSTGFKENRKNILTKNDNVSSRFNKLDFNFQGAIRTEKHCNFCYKNDEIKDVYKSHNLKQGNVVVCPVLRKLVCIICGASGDNAHTRKYCPQNLQVPGEKPKYRRLANGVLTTRHNHK